MSVAFQIYVEKNRASWHQGRGKYPGTVRSPIEVHKCRPAFYRELLRRMTSQGNHIEAGLLVLADDDPGSVGRKLPVVLGRRVRIEAGQFVPPALEGIDRRENETFSIL